MKCFPKVPENVLLSSLGLRRKRKPADLVGKIELILVKNLSQLNVSVSSVNEVFPRCANSLHEKYYFNRKNLGEFFNFIVLIKKLI